MNFNGEIICLIKLIRLNDASLDYMDKDKLIIDEFF